LSCHWLHWAELRPYRSFRSVRRDESCHVAWLERRACSSGVAAQISSGSGSWLRAAPTRRALAVIPLAHPAVRPALSSAPPRRRPRARSPALCALAQPLRVLPHACALSACPPAPKSRLPQSSKLPHSTRRECDAAGLAEALPPQQAPRCGRQIRSCRGPRSCSNPSKSHAALHPGSEARMQSHRHSAPLGVTRHPEAPSHTFFDCVYTVESAARDPAPRRVIRRASALGWNERAAPRGAARPIKRRAKPVIYGTRR
jgi:hypothetical protein